MLKVVIQHINRDTDEQVIIQCYETTETVKQIKEHVESMDSFIIGLEDQKSVRIPLHDIYYVESVDNKTFAYLNKRVITLEIKLYQFEEMAQEKGFIRISKSIVLNLHTVENAKSALNGRIILELDNAEKVMVTRHYVPELRKRLRGETV